VKNPTTDLAGLCLALDTTTAYEGRRQSSVVRETRVGTHVTVWYRSNGDGIRVADRVRVHDGDR
jgi:hypothetical protein